MVVVHKVVALTADSIPLLWWLRCCRYNGDVLDLMLKLTHKIPDVTPKHLAHEVRTNAPPAGWGCLLCKVWLTGLIGRSAALPGPVHVRALQPHLGGDGRYGAVLGYAPTTWAQCLFPKAQISRCSLPDWLPLLREEVEAMNFDPAYPALPFDKLHRTDLLSLFINEVRPGAHTPPRQPGGPMVAHSLPHHLANRRQTRRFYPSAVIEWGKAKLTFEYGDYVIPENFKLMGTRHTRGLHHLPPPPNRIRLTPPLASSRRGCHPPGPQRPQAPRVLQPPSLCWYPPAFASPHRAGSTLVNFSLIRFGLGGNATQRRATTSTRTCPTEADRATALPRTAAWGRT